MSNPKSVKKKVFIFEDDENFAIMLKEFFDLQGFEVRYAIHPREGMIVVDDFLPDVIITDINMPEVDGFNVFKEMKRKFPAVPVVVITAEHKLERLFDLEGVDAFMKKPFQLEALAKKVIEVLR